MLAKGLTDKCEQHVAKSAKFQLVVLDGRGCVRGVAGLMTGFARRGRPKEGCKLYVHVPQAVVDVSHGGSGLIVPEVRDVGAKHEQETDDRTADGVRLGVKRDGALRRELHVCAAQTNLEQVGHRADRGGHEHLRNDPPQSFVAAVEEAGKERERVTGILPGRKLVGHDHRRCTAASKITAQILGCSEHVLDVRSLRGASCEVLERNEGLSIRHVSDPVR